MRLLSSIRGVMAVALAAASLPFLRTHAADSAADSLILGNSMNKAVGYLQAGSSGKAGFALRYPDARMQAYRGCRITAVAVNVDYTDGMTPVRVFIGSSLDGSPICEQTFMPDRSGWTLVTLDTPYEVDGSALYIGYEGEGMRLLPYGTQLVAGEEWVRRKNSNWQLYNEGYSALIYAVVKGEALPANDVSISHIVMPGYAIAGAPLHYEGEFVNLGTADVKSLTFTFHAGDKQSTATVSGLSVEPRTIGTFEIDGLTIGDEGGHDVWIEATAVNGEADAAPYDNVSRHTEVICRSEFTPRKVLLEVFSTELCTGCPAGHAAITSALGDKTDIVEIGHHAGYYEDGLTISESKDYEWFYKTSMLYAPAVMFDRSAFTANYPLLYPDTVPTASPTLAMLPVVYGEAAAVPAFVSVDIQPTLDSGTRRLSLHVSGRELLTSGAQSPRLFVFLTEDSVYSTTQAGASKGFYHRFVARRSLTPTWGDIIDPALGFAADYTADIPQEWNIGMMRAVAFVANYDADDKSNCRVMNVNEVALAELLPAAIGDVLHDGTPLLQTERGHIVTPRGFDRLTVHDMTGRCLLDAHDGEAMQSVELPAGVYAVRATRGSETAVMKVVSGR